MATEPEWGLDDQATDFASRVASLLDGTVADSTPVIASRLQNRMQVAPLEQEELRPVVLMRDGRPVIDLWLQYLCSWDSYKSYLAVDKSKIHVCVYEVKEPLLRFEYERSRQDGLDAHIHVHAASTGLGWLSALTGKPRRPQLRSLHLPVGGRCFRTSLEDVIEMLVKDIGVEPKQGWEAQLEGSREEWLAIQTQVATRHRPDKAAKTLRDLGWNVSPPDD